MPSVALGETTATLEVSGCAPPMPSICRGSGLPMTRSSRSSRSAGPAGRSLARKYAPFEVPPRICMQRMPSLMVSRLPLASLAGPLDVLGVADPLDLLELGPQVVHVHAERAVGELLAVLVLLGDPGGGGGDGLAHVQARHDAHAVVVGDDRVTWPDELAADGDGDVDRAGGLLDRALRRDVGGPGREVHLPQLLGVAQPRGHHEAAHAVGAQRRREQLAERAVAVRRCRRDHHDVARPGVLDRGVDHQVVTRPAQHGQRGARDARALLVRPDGRAEVAGAADRLVDGGDAVFGQLAYLVEIGARRVGDDDVQHVWEPRFLSVTVYYGACRPPVRVRLRNAGRRARHSVAGGPQGLDNAVQVPPDGLVRVAGPAAR